MKTVKKSIVYAAVFIILVSMLGCPSPPTRFVNKYRVGLLARPMPLLWPSYASPSRLDSWHLVQWDYKEEDGRICHFQNVPAECGHGFYVTACTSTGDPLYESGFRFRISASTIVDIETNQEGNQYAITDRSGNAPFFCICDFGGELSYFFNHTENLSVTMDNKELYGYPPTAQFMEDIWTPFWNWRTSGIYYYYGAAWKSMSTGSSGACAIELPSFDPDDPNHCSPSLVLNDVSMQAGTIPSVLNTPSSDDEDYCVFSGYLPITKPTLKGVFWCRADVMTSGWMDSTDAAEIIPTNYFRMPENDPNNFLPFCRPYYCTVVVDFPKAVDLAGLCVDIKLVGTETIPARLYANYTRKDMKRWIFKTDWIIVCEHPIHEDNSYRTFISPDGTRFCLVPVLDNSHIEIKPSVGVNSLLSGIDFWLEQNSAVDINEDGIFNLDDLNLVYDQ